MDAHPQTQSRPLNVLIPTLGSAGDVHPYVAVALALKARGHHPVILTNPYFRERILNAGVGFWGVGTSDDYLSLVKDPRLIAARTSAAWVFEHLIMGQFDALASQTREAARVLKIDVVFAHHIAFGALCAAEAMRLPLVQGVLAPLFWLSREEPLAMPTWPMPDAPRWVRRAQGRLLRLGARWTIDPKVNRARKGMKLPPLKNAVVTSARGRDGLLARERLTDHANAITTLGLWSPRFRTAMRDDPIAGHICGFCAWDRPMLDERASRPLRELLQWMSDGPPPVLVTLGSSVSHHGADLYAACAGAIESQNLRGVILTGSDPAPFASARIRCVTYAPYSSVMSRSAAVVHHAGIGTLAGGLRAGTPSLIVPFANDEFDNAARAQRLGVAAIVRRRDASPMHLATAIRAVIDNQAMSVRARELAQHIRSEDGPAVAASIIERHAGHQRPA